MRTLFDIEKSVIGYFLMDGSAHTRMDVLPEWFESDVTRDVFNAFRNEEKANPYLMAEKFGDSHISDLVANSCSHLDIAENIKAMKNSYRSKKAIDALNRAITDVRNGGDVGEWIEHIAKEFDDPSGAERTRDLADVLLDRYNKIEAIQKGGEEPDDYIHTGFYDFDDRIGGFLRGDMTLIGGRPSMGKTSLALGSALWQARNGKRVLWFNMDSSEASIANRSFASTGATMENIRKANPSKDDWGKMASSHTIDKGMFSIDSTPGLTISKLCGIARRQNRKNQIDVVYIDYMQQLAGSGTEYERVTQASGDLKRLANELNASVVALVQLNRDLEKRADKRPLLSDLRSSGQLEQDAYMVIFPYRPEEYAENETDKKNLEGKVELLIRKHKDGPTGVMSDSLSFDSKSTRFVNASHERFGA